MPMVMNKGVNIFCKAVNHQVFAVVGLFVELDTVIAKQPPTARNILTLVNITLQ